MGSSRPTVLQLAMARRGVLGGSRVVAFMIAWDIAEQRTGTPLSVRKYAQWWRISESTAFREIRQFHEVFPDEQNPSRIMNSARLARWDESQGVNGLGALPLDDLQPSLLDAS